MFVETLCQGDKHMQMLIIEKYTKKIKAKIRVLLQMK